MGHDGGVEDGRRFEGIFARKERPDQQFTGAGEGSMRENMAADPFKMNPEQRLDIEMARVEFTPHRFEVTRDILFAQGQGPADDRDDAVTLLRNEGADDDPRAFGKEGDVVAAETDGTHAAAFGWCVTRCSAHPISARERWKASVDSAP